MKKIALIVLTFLLVISFAGCAPVDEKCDCDGVYFYGTDENIHINFISSVDIYKSWESQQGVRDYQGDAIPDHNTALNVALAIFESIKGELVKEEFVPMMVYYDEACEIYKVTFWWKDPPYELGGGEWSIVLQKSDGKVLRIYSPMD